VFADSNCDVIKEIVYDPFGGIIADSNPGFRIPIGFAGGLHDRDLSFVRFGWRDYDTFTDRWTAPDPLGDKGGDPDWYGYCLDDPVNGNDPFGLLKNEYGEEIPDGRIITEYCLGWDTPFSGYATSKKVKNALKSKSSEYTDENDWKMRKELSREADNYNTLKGVWDGWFTDTDEEIIRNHYDKARMRIGK